MKRKIFSAVLALVMLLTLAPTVFAVGETEDVELIELPTGQTVEFKVEPIDPPEDIPMAAQETTYDIDDPSDFKRYAETDNNLFIRNNTFYITQDLDLSELFPEGTPYTTGAMTYLYGNIIGRKENGEAPVISGIPDGMYFVQYMVGGTIKNLTFDYGDQQGAITNMYTRFGGDNQEQYNYMLTLEDITIAKTQAPVDIGNNYSPFVFCSPYGGLTMKNCVNNMDMVGTTYSSIFYGYHPMVTENAPIVFESCVNNGTLITDKAGMFFGNSTGLDNYLRTLNLTIVNCENNGSIRGITSAYYLCAAAAQDGEFAPGTLSGQIEDILAGTTPESEEFPNIHKVAQGENSFLGKEEHPVEFSGVWDGQDITLTPAAEDAGVAYYIVQIGAYINVWEELSSTEGEEPTYRRNGSRLYVVESRIETSDIDTSPYPVPLKAYDFADVGNGLEYTVDDISYVRWENGQIYFAVEREPREGYLYTVSDSINTPASEPAQLVIISAYNSQGYLLGAVYLNNQEATNS